MVLAEVLAVRRAGVLLDGGHELAEVVGLLDPELDPAGAAGDAGLGGSVLTSGGGGFRSSEIGGDARLADDDPGVVAGADDVGVAGTQIEFRPWSIRTCGRPGTSVSALGCTSADQLPPRLEDGPGDRGARRERCAARRGRTCAARCRRGSWLRGS